MNQVNQFLQAMDWPGLLSFLLTMGAVLLCLTVHELSHGLAAYLLGDPTAKSQKRLSLNPLRHLDFFGTLMMLVAGFGWAKPVPVDMRYFKNPKSGMAVTALAGPLSNLLLAYAVLFVRSALFPFVLYGSWGGWEQVDLFLIQLASLSVGLGVFNLIPFPPLDGSKILEGVLPDRIYYTILRYERFGMIALMVVLWTGILDGPLNAVRWWVLQVLQSGSYWVMDLVMKLM